MRLKSIKLAGFKSFVDPTHVQLSSNMVAIIGPNGCGKSNIIDAVRWVMGESSAKNLRGESMTDVIFNGSTGRKPVGQASIELIFDNSDGSLTGEYAGFTEIGVKRKVTRDGQSQYFLNGTKCRRRDITDIFLGTGLGPRSYAIIEQGMISRLIESKPEELRVFVEEAAGISKYKERRRETETRIRHTRENLERLTDLREELDRQLQRLKRQAAAAEKYKLLKAEERTVKSEVQALQWQALRNQSGDQRAEIQDHEVKLEAAVAEHRRVDADIEEHRVAHAEKTERFNDVQAKYYGLGSDIARLEQSIKHHEERAQQLLEDLAETDRNAAESAKHLREDKEKLQTWDAELNELLPQMEALSEQSTASADARSEAEQKMQAWQQGWDSFSETASEPQRNAEVQRTRIEQFEAQVRSLGERVQRQQDEYAGLDASDIQAAVTLLSQEITAADVQVGDFSQSLESSVAQLSEMRDERKATQGQLDEARGELQQQKGRRASLEALQQAAADDAEGGSKQWLSQHGLSAAPRLLERVQVASGWETAVETVLGDSLQAICVDQLSAVSEWLGELESNVSLVELAPSSADAKGVDLPSLASKVDGDIGALLDGIYVTDDLSAALARRAQLSANQSIVTTDGVWLGANWLRVVREKDAQAGILARRKELESLNASIEQQSDRVSELDAALQTLDTRLAEGETQREQLLQQLRSEEKAQSERRASLATQQGKIEQILARRERIANEVKENEASIGMANSKLADARELLETAITAMNEVAQEREQRLAEKESIQTAYQEARSKAEADRSAAQESRLRVESLRTRTQSVQQTIDRLTQQVLQLEEKKASLEASQAENQQPVAEMRTQLEAQLAARMTVEVELGEARKLVESIDQSMRQLDKARAQAERETQQIREALEKLRIDSQSVEVRLKTIEEQLEESGFTLQAVVESMPEEAELEAWQKQLADITRRIQNLGAINLAAIDEYESESERKTHLDAQNEELEKALATLEDAIRKIDKETRSLFKDTFDKLNSGLQELFPKIFGGGKAYLELTGEDLLDTGIAIMARPPGKQNSTIHLLSGGEKALTALALVFSIFRLNPAPFCMLDEVDAPLDDANVGRYARLVKEMSDTVQFIFITHNKVTMEAADHLMGVTMHEPGVSRLVSVDIDEAAKMAAI